MTRSLRAAGCASRTASKPSFKAVWITDAVLADSLRRVTCPHRRHGSNVPGPLEAQKRASKRRNTSLAYNGDCQPPADVGVLFSGGPQRQWWEKQQPNGVSRDFEPDSLRPESLASRALPFILPSWLYPQPEPPAPSAKIDWNLPRSTSFNRELKQCHSAKDVHALLASRNINLRTEPRAAIAIFGHVLDANWPANEVATYLTDPMLNPPGTTNHLRLIQRIANPDKRCLYRSPSHWQVLSPALCKAARLGLIAPPEMRKMIGVLLIQQQPVATKLGPTGFSQTPEAVVSLLESFEQSQIFELKDLGRQWLRSLFSSCTVKQAGSSLMKLLWMLRVYQDPDAVTLFSSVVRGWLQKSVSTGDINDALLALPRETLLPIISRVTEDLISEKHSVPELPPIFAAWSEVLRASNFSEAADQRELDSSDLDLLWQGFHRPLDEQERLLAAAWILYSLSYRKGWSKAQINTLSLSQKFEAAFHGMRKEPSVDLLATVVLKLQNMPLPNKAEFLRHISVLTKYRYILYSGTRSPNKDVEKLLSHELACLGDDAFYKNATYNFNDALVELCQSANTDLRGFTAAAVSLINANKAYFKIVTRLLQHNLDCKLALSKSSEHGSAPVRSTNYGDAHKDSAELQSPTSAFSETSKNITPDILDTVNRLAVAFAKTQAAGPRLALRKVYWCYLFLHRYGAPIQPIISSALWHAGVTRYGIDNCSKSQLDWILKVVRAVEGREVARALLLNSSVRKHREEVFEQLSPGSGQSMEEVRAELEWKQSPIAKIFREKQQESFVDLSKTDEASG